jgi:hypothetical protein
MILPTATERKELLAALSIPGNLNRSFDLVRLPSARKNLSRVIVRDPSSLVLVELKTTKKALANNPYGFFFGATENEYTLARMLGSNFVFCFVCLHEDHQSISLRSLGEVEEMTRSKRVQYQVNLVAPPKG